MNLSDWSELSLPAIDDGWGLRRFSKYLKLIGSDLNENAEPFSDPLRGADGVVQPGNETDRNTVFPPESSGQGNPDSGAANGQLVQDGSGPLCVDASAQTRHQQIGHTPSGQSTSASQGAMGQGANLPGQSFAQAEAPAGQAVYFQHSPGFEQNYPNAGMQVGPPAQQWTEQQQAGYQGSTQAGYQQQAYYQNTYQQGAYQGQQFGGSAAPVSTNNKKTTVAVGVGGLLLIGIIMGLFFALNRDATSPTALQSPSSSSSPASASPTARTNGALPSGNKPNGALTEVNSKDVVFPARIGTYEIDEFRNDDTAVYVSQKKSDIKVISIDRSSQQSFAEEKSNLTDIEIFPGGVCGKFSFTSASCALETKDGVLTIIGTSESPLELKEFATEAKKVLEEG